MCHAKVEDGLSGTAGLLDIATRGGGTGNGYNPFMAKWRSAWHMVQQGQPSARLVAAARTVQCLRAQVRPASRVVVKAR